MTKDRDDDAPRPPSPLSRRDFATRIAAGLGAVALLRACGDDDEARGTDSGARDTGQPPARDTGPAGVDAGPGTDAGPAIDGGPGTCTVYPRQTEGPYYLDLDMVRRDVTEGKAGIPLVLVVEVVDASCAPIRDAAVDIWHCDVAGVYSGYPGQLGGVDTSGMTFLRGSQITDGEGRATFDTIYPGWYPGRTTHIHFKVHLSSTVEATSQLYFEESLNESIYGMPPYDARGQKDTSNLEDGIARSGGGSLPALPTVTMGATGYTATLRVTVAG